MLCRDMTRDRLKLIARVVNVEQWAKEGPLSGYEHSLLNNYNDKPILTRPQQQFFSGENYLEVDLDVHTYAWLARKAFANFIPRLGKSLPAEHLFPLTRSQFGESPLKARKRTKTTSSAYKRHYLIGRTL